ncbi:hypothetical protein [Nocardia sp. NPDC049149]|uniref:hypothetical protein n=1 Tax=Nocardia sp. NPDC049149 TaxID=3364315 RepID=UPI00371D51DF
MNENEFARYVALYNSGNFRHVVDDYYHENIRIDIYGVNFTRGALDTLQWLQNSHDGLIETMLVDDLRISANGRDVYARVRERLVALEVVKRLASGPLVPGQVRTTTFHAHFLVKDGRFVRIALDLPKEPLPQLDRPVAPATARELRQGPPMISPDIEGDAWVVDDPAQWIAARPQSDWLSPN